MSRLALSTRTLSCFIILCATCVILPRVALSGEFNLTCDAGGPYAPIPCASNATSIQLDGSGSTQNEYLEYIWSTTCPNGSFDDRFQVSPVLTLDSVNPDLTPVNCLVELRVGFVKSQNVETCTAPVVGTACVFDCLGQLNGPAVVDQCGVCNGNGSSCLDCAGQPNGTAALDRCGVCNGDGNSCLGCNSLNVTSTLVILDGSARSQRNLLRFAVKALIAADPKKYTASGQRTLSTAHKLYLQNWNTTWSIPKVVVTCANTNFCTAASNAGILAAYEKNARTLNDLILSAAKNLAKVNRRKADKISKQAKAILTRISAELTKVPSSSSSCS